MISSVRLGCVDADSSLQLLSLLTTCLTIFYGIVQANMAFGAVEDTKSASAQALPRKPCSKPAHSSGLAVADSWLCAYSAYSWL